MKNVAILVGSLLLFPVTGAAQSGVLVGIATRGEHNLAEPPQRADSFATIWVTHDGPGQAHVAATLPALIVPRRDGFWRVGVTNVCERTDDDEEDREVVWATRLAAAPFILAGRPCAPPRPAATAPLSELERRDAVRRCGRQSVTLRFVSADFLSGDTYAGVYGGCEVRGFDWTESEFVIRFDTRSPVSFLSIAGPSAARAYSAAIARGADELRRDGFDCSAVVKDIVDDFLGWSIGRRDGRWRAHAFVQPWKASCQFGDEARVSLPRAVTGPDALGLSWRQILATAPDAIDAFSSPAGDMMVVVSKTEMRVFETSNGALGRALTTLPAGNVVMIQWALGSNVARWTTSLREATRVKLPEPTIRVTSK